MSLAVWLGSARKCSAAVVGLDLVLGLSMVRRCSLKRSFKRRLVFPMYCKLQRFQCTNLPPSLINIKKVIIAKLKQGR